MSGGRTEHDSSRDEVCLASAAALKGAYVACGGSGATPTGRGRMCHSCVSTRRRDALASPAKARRKSWVHLKHYRVPESETCFSKLGSRPAARGHTSRVTYRYTKKDITWDINPRETRPSPAARGARPRRSASAVRVVGGFQLQTVSSSDKHRRKRKLRIDAFSAPQAEPLRVSKFQAYPRTPHCMESAAILLWFRTGKPVASCGGAKRSIEAKTSIHASSREV